jgi:3-phosphoshikimate 1-carboxyvinyltransferase
MKWIRPSKIDGRVAAPPSKSMMLRATAAAVLSREDSLIRNPSSCEDALAGLRIAEGLGGRVEKDARAVRIRGGGPLKSGTLDCGESGLCMWMFAPIAALFDRPLTLVGRGSLVHRPMDTMEAPLRGLGAACRSAGGFAPLRVKGPLAGGRVTLDGSLSSQFLTGLLMALPFCPCDSEIRVTNLESRPYAVMTLSFLRRFGLEIDAADELEIIRIAGGQRFRRIDYRVEGDWSGAAFLLVAGALGGRADVSRLQAGSDQPDRRILEALDLAGAKIAVKKNRVVVEHGNLKGFDFDAADCPDLFPPLAALACHCEGRTRIYGVARLKHKESDRGRVLCREFAKAGAKISVRENYLEIYGRPLAAAVIDAHGDHRIAMAVAVAALNSKRGLGIDGAECVAKSYPRFFEDLKSLGGQIT